ncbi:MAG: exodeoxyribonuclease V subunit gamma [Magnetococcales bacterium]|nr:exodeoxyribonuclease V subunit gamma [Magnetococcales bacterium]
MKAHPSGLILIHGNRIELLRDDLVERMHRAPLAPLENEIILVQSNGMAQWLKLGIAGEPGGQGGGGLPGVGIAAALELLLPARFLWQVYRAVLGGEGVPEESPFDKTRLIWRLMRLLPELAVREPFAPLRRFLERDDDLRKRFQLAERLADLLDGYQVYRADWLAAWAGGEDRLIDARGGSDPLPEEQRWQAALWRALREDVNRHPDEDEEKGLRASRAGRAEVHAAFLRRAAGWRDRSPPPGLPRRVMVFGITSLPRQSVEVLVVLSRWTQVVMYVHNPCQYFWADIVPERELLRGGRRGSRVREGFPESLPEGLMHLHAQPLLAAWGMQGRDFIGLLEEYAGEGIGMGDADSCVWEIQREECFVSTDPEPQTLLQQLQDDILELRPLDETRMRWPEVRAHRDRSIGFHVAHGPLREVEILHDRLLAAFQADPSLTPRDVLVMVPDINGYAALVQAVFGLPERHDPRFIPFVLANRERRPADPLLVAVERLLALPQARLTASDLIDWLEVPALRRRFALAEEDLPTLRVWIRDSGIRWGLNESHRVALGLPERVGEEALRHTWLFGLRRMLLGYAVGDRGGVWRGVVPYDEIDAGGAELLGALAGFVEALERHWRILGTPAPVREWCARFRGLLGDFFLPGDDDGDAYTLMQLDGVLDPWLELCDEAGLNDPLPLSVVGEYWLSRLEEGGLSQGFFADAVTFATLMPMRAIPFRQVCLLGMNDGEFPRPGIRMDFDLMRGRYRPGDRSRREDDRYLFLEARLSARQTLYLSWVGRSIHDHAEAPPSVLVGQLRDHLAAGWVLADAPGSREERGMALVKALTVEHRLQPFSRDYFPVVADRYSPWFTYAHEWRPGEREAREKRQSGVPDATSPACSIPKMISPDGCAPDSLSPETDSASLLPPETLISVPRVEPLTLRELGQFLKDPVKHFFMRRLGVDFKGLEPMLDDCEPFSLDGLESWKLRDALLRKPESAAIASGLEEIRLRGALADGGFGQLMSESLRITLEEVVTRVWEQRARWPIPGSGGEELLWQGVIDGESLEIADRVTGIGLDLRGERGRVVVTASVLTQDRHDRYEKVLGHWVEHLGGHLAGGPLTTVIVSGAGEISFRPLTVEAAEARLREIVAAWQSGMRRPLPLAPGIALAWLRDGGAAGEASGAFLRACEREWSGNSYLTRVYPDFAALSASGEFAMLAERLLRPLIDAGPGGTDADG